MIAACARALRSFLSAKGGNVAMTLGLTLFGVVGIATLALDFTRANAVKTELQAAIDAGVLAAARARQANLATWESIGTAAFEANLAKAAGATAAFSDTGWRVDGDAQVVSSLAGGGLFGDNGIGVKVWSAAVYGEDPGSSSGGSGTPPGGSGGSGSSGSGSTSTPTPPQTSGSGGAGSSGSSSGSSSSGAGSSGGAGAGSSGSGGSGASGGGGGGGRSGGFGGCILVLNPTMQSAIHMNSGARIEVNCGIQVNSAHADAVWINNGARIEAPETRVAGGVNTINGGQITALPKTYQPALADPLAALPEPSTAGPCQGVNVNSNETLTINPGVYCGYFNVNSNGRVRLNPGTYVFSTHVNVNSGARIEGDGVTLYFANGGKLQANSSSRWTLSAPTSGTYHGIVVFYGRSNSDDLIMNADVQDEFQGVIYAPAARLLLNSQSDFRSDVALVVNNIHNNSTIELARPMGSCGASATMAPQLMATCAGSGGSGACGGSGASGSGGGGSSGSAGGGSTSGGGSSGGGSGSSGSGGGSSGGSTTGGSAGGSTTGGSTTGGSSTPPSQTPIRLVR